MNLARNKFPKGEFKAESFPLSLAFSRIHCSVLVDVVMSQKRHTEQLLLRKTFGRYALESGFIGSLPSSPIRLTVQNKGFPHPNLNFLFTEPNLDVLLLSSIEV